MLLIESSTERAMVAIVEGGQILFHAELPFGYQHSRHLMPQIDKGLRLVKRTLQDMEAIAVGIGPGSFTGIRVGAMAAKALSFAASVPLVGICTLKTFIPAEGGEYTSLIDAKMGGAYVSLNGADAEIMPLEQLGERLAGRLVTPHASLLKQKFERLYPGSSWIWEEAAPNPLKMASLARHKLAAGEYTIDGHLELLYLSKTQAQNF